MDESSDRGRQRDQRERDVIAHLALIAPSPELIKRVVLDVPEQSQPLDGRPADATVDERDRRQAVAR